MPVLSDYKIVLYCQPDGSWVAYVPAIEGCHAVMPAREDALRELEDVFEMIRAEHAAEGRALPADVELVHA
ncbi:MAG: type II toxin-antitoxin system HicB family antitoxin [Armatimonadetes bacterium]|nr:type II toxin-antitoxin system HicB family antitoxin [Armatimonadota bacterium]